jgi:hypothetical protein
MASREESYDFESIPNNIPDEDSEEIEPEQILVDRDGAPLWEREIHPLESDPDIFQEE